MAIEHAHWADEATLNLVHYLGRRIDVTRSLVIVTHRDDEIGPRPATRANPAGLTRREIEILGLSAVGHGNRDVADRLFISSRTVENHVSAILAKLGAASRLEAIALTERLGIISQPE